MTTLLQTVIPSVKRIGNLQKLVKTQMPYGLRPWHDNPATNRHSQRETRRESTKTCKDIDAIRPSPLA